MVLFNKIRNTGKISFIVLFILILGSCGSRSVYEDFKPFENKSWNRFNDQHFEYAIEDINSKYTIKIILVLDKNIKHNTIPFDTRIITPGGEERLMSHKLHLNRQAPVESTAGDNKQLYSALLLKDYEFNQKGLVKIDVHNRMPVTQISGVYEIGLRVLIN